MLNHLSILFYQSFFCLGTKLATNIINFDASKVCSVFVAICAYAAQRPFQIDTVDESQIRKAQSSIPRASRYFVKLYKFAKKAKTIEEIRKELEKYEPIDIDGVPVKRKRLEVSNEF